MELHKLIAQSSRQSNYTGIQDQRMDNIKWKRDKWRATTCHIVSCVRDKSLHLSYLWWRVASKPQHTILQNPWSQTYNLVPNDHGQSDCARAPKELQLTTFQFVTCFWKISSKATLVEFLQDFHIWVDKSTLVAKTN